MTRCPRCSATWAGLKTAHCAACHITFSTPANFDRHRPGECLAPASVGLVVIRKHGDTPIWGQPGLPEDADFRRDVFTETASQGDASVFHLASPHDGSQAKSAPHVTPGGDPDA